MSTTDKPTWQLAEQICEVPAVDEAIRTFVEDNTGDNAIGLVLAVLEHQAATEAAKATSVAAGEQVKPYAWVNAGTQRQQTEHATLNVGSENPWKDGANAFPVYTHPAPTAPQQYADTRVRELECVIADLTRECKELRAEAARQPAPALPVKTWQERIEKDWQSEGFAAMQSEIAELRALLASQDKLLRDSVPMHWKDCTSPVGAAQSYIAELESALAATAAPLLPHDLRIEIGRFLADLGECAVIEARMTIGEDRVKELKTIMQTLLSITNRSQP